MVCLDRNAFRKPLENLKKGLDLLAIMEIYAEAGIHY